MAFTVFDAKTKKNHLTQRIFLDGGVDIQRYDKVKYPKFLQLTDQQDGYFWQPEEVDISKDARDYKEMLKYNQLVYPKLFRRQTLMDSVQGRSPSLGFLPFVSLPEVEAFLILWPSSERIHSKSYTHLIKNIFPDPSIVFDEMKEVDEIVECAGFITKYYDRLIRSANLYSLLGFGTHEINGETIVVDPYQIKKDLYMTLISVNILEGVLFYASFAVAWAFAENKLMEGNAKIIKLIARDENLHLAFTQYLLKILPKDDPDFVKIYEECRGEAIELYREAAEQEKKWSEFLLDGASILGLNVELLKSYVEFITNKRMVAIGLPKLFTIKENPLPWTQSWIAGHDVQPAPQETEITSYVSGKIIQDVDENTFNGFSL